MPLTLLLSPIEARLPEQSVCDVGVIVNTGVGLIVTLIVCDVPGQLPSVEVGVTV